MRNICYKTVSVILVLATLLSAFRTCVVADNNTANYEITYHYSQSNNSVVDIICMPYSINGYDIVVSSITGVWYISCDGNSTIITTTGMYHVNTHPSSLTGNVAIAFTHYFLPGQPVVQISGSISIC